MASLDTLKEKLMEAFESLPPKVKGIINSRVTQKLGDIFVKTPWAKVANGVHNLIGFSSDMLFKYTGIGDLDVQCQKAITAICKEIYKDLHSNVNIVLAEDCDEAFTFNPSRHYSKDQADDYRRECRELNLDSAAEHYEDKIIMVYYLNEIRLRGMKGEIDLKKPSHDDCVLFLAELLCKDTKKEGFEFSVGTTHKDLKKLLNKYCGKRDKQQIGTRVKYNKKGNVKTARSQSAVHKPKMTVLHNLNRSMEDIQKSHPVDVDSAKKWKLSILQKQRAITQLRNSKYMRLNKTRSNKKKSTRVIPSSYYSPIEEKY